MSSTPAATPPTPLPDAPPSLLLKRQGLWWLSLNADADGVTPPAEGDWNQSLWAAWHENAAAGARGPTTVALARACGNGRTYFEQRPDRTLRVAHEGHSRPGVVMASAENLQAAAAAAARDAGWPHTAPEAPSETPAGDDTYWYDQLGWCTWDAFYQQLTPEGIIAGLQAWANQGLTPGTLIIDDGWLDVHVTDAQDDVRTQYNNGTLHSFAADAEKFPDGLAPIIRQAKEEFGVRHVGVWHTLQGYWCGVNPDGPLAERYTIHRRRARDLNAFVLPNVPERGAIDPADVGRFFDDWHGQLAAAGVDFVKVDNGGSTPEFCDADEGPRYVRAYGEAVRTSAAKHFGPGGLLPCMSMDNTLAAAPDPGRSVHVFRNSDDFFPDKEESHATHIRNNAASSLWTSGFAIPDWDMFHTVHPWGPYHAAGRAISGGPVYVSDKVDESDVGLIRRLIDGDAKALRYPMPCTPLELAPERTVVRNQTRGCVTSTTLGLFRGVKGRPTLSGDDIRSMLPQGPPIFRSDTGELIIPGASVHAERYAMLHSVNTVDGNPDISVFGWSNAMCPTLTVLDVQADLNRVTVKLRPASDPEATVLFAVRDASATGWSLLHIPAQGNTVTLEL